MQCVDGQAECRAYLERVSPLKGPEQWRQKFRHWGMAEGLINLNVDRLDVRVTLWYTLSGDLTEPKARRQ